MVLGVLGILLFAVAVDLVVVCNSVDCFCFEFVFVCFRLVLVLFRLLICFGCLDVYDCCFTFVCYVGWLFSLF